ncbi:hypothetical protein L4D76_24130 [Photobacterium sagamiensis]|uniref:alpha-L-arabinofuranosidase C-terminal domain-containing protein n=1 Tax=Photobacterium sagamiensis TaxID=2910241 RepID=UPI003D0F382C
MKIKINTERTKGNVNPMIYGHFVEHFHRQVYGGVFDPSSKFADEVGLRTDVIEALKQIKTPIMRWPGGCFVDDYRWEKGVGEKRTPVFDKNWRVEEPHTFGTDEFINFCRKIEAEPFICTNGGTATPEDASNWIEYCNLENEGEFAKQRIANGHKEPYNVKYWSIGNENYYPMQIGHKDVEEWSKFTAQSAKLLTRITPNLELSVAATVSDLDWTYKILKENKHELKWISLHGYWDAVTWGEWGHVDTTYGIPAVFHSLIPYISMDGKNANYEKVMSILNHPELPVKKLRGVFDSLDIDHIKITYDEWNLRAWMHPCVTSGVTKEEYLYPRNMTDDNSIYTMADALFTAGFLNMCIRNSDIIGMANFSPVVNGRGAIFTHENGIVKRSTYHVFDLYANKMGDKFVDTWSGDIEKYEVNDVEVDVFDIVSAIRTSDNVLTVSVLNKHATDSKPLKLAFEGDINPVSYSIHSVVGTHKDAYNDIDRTDVTTEQTASDKPFVAGEEIEFPPHSVSIIELKL